MLKLKLIEAGSAEETVDPGIGQKQICQVQAHRTARGRTAGRHIGIGQADRRVADGRGDRTVYVEGISYFVPHAFVVAKDEPLVLDDGPARRGAELVQQQIGKRLRVRIEVVARIESAVAMEVVGRAVKIVAARLEADIHHRAGLPSVFGALILLGVELLDGVERQDGWRRSGDANVVDHAFAVVDVIVIGPIDRVVVVFKAVSVGRDAVKTAARRALDSGTKFQQVLKIPALQRQFVDQLVAHGAAQRVGDGIDRRLFTRDFAPPPRSARA